MCGRVNVSDHEGVQQLLQRLGISLNKDSFTPRFNVAPGADVLVAFQSEKPDLAEMHWGIVPHWARDKPGSRPMINARVETAWDKPSFKKLIRATRAIVPVNGFYEWHRDGKEKTPYYIKLAGAGAMALAGIYQITREGTMEFAVLTRESTGDMGAIHDRMPVTIEANNLEAWLALTDEAAIKTLLANQDEPALELVRVSSYVNNAANEGNRCIEPVAA